MKHLHALLLVLTLILVSAAWCLPPASGSGSSLDQVTLTQHQEAALPAALVGIDLVEAHLVVSAQSAPHIEATYSVDASQTAILDQVSVDVFDVPATAVQTLLNTRPMSGHRRPVETPGPASWKAVAPLRCPSGGTTASILTAPHPSTSGA